ncbi:MAG: hypothetical protein P4L46_02265 [Fimbriimonas sp.]|nr:hypothetical protein [Fimbriimonas sp.]
MLIFLSSIVVGSLGAGATGFSVSYPQGPATSGSTAAQLRGREVGPPSRFRVVDDHGSMYLQGPDGKPFFSLGVCCVDTGTSYADYDPKNPSYAAFKYYAEGKQQWADDVVQRLQSWGFNTIGAWSDAKTLRQVIAPELKFTPILHMGSGAGAPWKDMWDRTVVSMMSDIARDQIKDLKSESRVIGYFSDNEQGWWNGALFEWAWKGAGTRKLLVGQLESRYKSWAALLGDFEPASARSFTELKRAGRLFLRPGSNGIAAVHAYIGALADRYYSLCNSLIKKYDPKALYLGDRFISNFYPEVAKAAGKYADVVSTNLNADWNDGTVTPFYLPSLHRIAGKPLMITEYYMCAKENRTGNKNDSSGFPLVQTQAERAQGFLTTTRVLLQTPYVVGAHWFQYYDEPKNGRGDGENYNMGLVDVYNDPYEDLTGTASRLALADRKPLDAVISPSVPSITLSDVKDLEKWPRAEAYLKPSRDSERGDAFVAWSAGSAYLAIYWNEDRFPEAFYRSGRVPTEDEPIATIGLPTGLASLRLVEGKPAVGGLAELVSLKMGVRNTAIIRISAKALGLTTPASNQKLRFNVSLQTRSRAYSIRWACSKPLSE